MGVRQVTLLHGIKEAKDVMQALEQQTLPESIEDYDTEVGPRIRLQHISDSQGQILALAFMKRPLKTFE